jgi:hypothetical protein
MTSWQVQSSYNGSLVDADVDSRNVVGSPLVSVGRVGARESGSNTASSGVFRLTMQSTTTVSVLVQHYGDLNSPVVFTGTSTVVADGSTQNLNLVLGLSVVLSSHAASGDVFEIGVGCHWDSDSSSWVRILPLDLVVSPSTSEERTLYAKNISGSTQCNSELTISNSMRVVNGQAVNRPFFAFRQTGLTNPVADSNLNGKPVTFTDLVEGTPNTVSILIGGPGVNVYDVTNDASLSNGVGLKCDETTIYRFDDSSDYRSGEFILSSGVTETDTAVVYVSDGGDFVEISDGNSAFVAGTSGIYLTEENAPEGVVTNSTAVPFKVRLISPPGKTLALNQRQFSIRVQSEGI